MRSVRTVGGGRAGSAFAAALQATGRWEVVDVLGRNDDVSAAADGVDLLLLTVPDTAVADFFICIGAQPELDFGGKRNPDGQGFGAFGKVVKGMDVVRAIQQAPASGQQLTTPIKIIRAARKP